MFEFSQQFKDDLFILLGDDCFSDKELKQGISSLEKIISITDETSIFNEEFWKEINQRHLLDPQFDISVVCKPEGFLRKLCNLKGIDTEGLQLGRLYDRIGFYDWLNDEDIKKARVNDPANSANANNNSGEGFHLNDADASAYDGCPHFFKDYIVTYQLRNAIKAHDNPMDGTFKERLERIACVFVVYLDQCIQNTDIIERGFFDTVLSTEIDFVDFAEKQLKAIPQKEAKVLEHFCQLDWQDRKEGGENLKYDFSRCIKLYGEPGLGKTTQMRKLYFSLLNEVIDGSRKSLPIWINLSELPEGDNSSLENYIKENHEELKSLYDLLLDKNKIALFLDGYNEILGDNPLAARRVIADQIDDLHEKYPDLYIAITDRTSISIPYCLTEDVILYTCYGLNERQMLEYTELTAGEEIKQKVKNYIKSERGAWFASVNVSPIKMNCLIELFNKGKEPENEDEYYVMYLDYVIHRENREKHETSMETLISLLGALAKEMKHHAAEKSKSEIQDIWNRYGIGIEKFNRYLTLAVEMEILSKEKELYHFKHKQYYDVIKKRWG